MTVIFKDTAGKLSDFRGNVFCYFIVSRKLPKNFVSKIKCFLNETKYCDSIDDKISLRFIITICRRFYTKTNALKYST